MMRKINVMLKVISLVLALSFITTQVSIAKTAEISSKDTLAPASVFGNTNEKRHKEVQEDIAKKLTPSAIGNGKPLVDLMRGNIPPKIKLRPELAKKLRVAIKLAISLSVQNSMKVASQQDKKKYQLATENLVTLSNNLTGVIYPYNAVVLGPEDYLLGWNAYGVYVGLSIELIEKLPLHLLAQYVFHECVPERTIIAEAITKTELITKTGLITKTEATTKTRLIDLSDHYHIYNELQSAIFGAEVVEALGRELRDFINDKLYETRSATTLKFPGAPALIYGSVEYKDLIAKIKANYSRPLTREELIYIRNIIQSKAPPTFFTNQEKEDIKNIVEALTGQISFQDLNLKLQSPYYKDKPLHNIAVNLIDLKDEEIFRTNQGNFYQEITTYNEATGTLLIHIPKAFLEERPSEENRSALTQAILHPLLEAIMGLSHQEAALALSFYNFIAAPGKVNISDVHRAIIKEVKKRAINGDKDAIRQLNALLNPNFKFSLTDADKRALEARGRTIESIGMIRAHSEELARIINGLVRGPIGMFDTRMPLSYIAPLPGMEKGEMPTQDILDKYSMITNATVAAAIAVVADGYVGKMADLTEKAEVKIIKDGADGLAKREMQVIFNLSGYRIIITVSEGGLRDAVEESFSAGEVIGKEGMKVISIALDVIENTTAVAKGKAGGVSLALSAEGDEMFGTGKVPDVY